MVLRAIRYRGEVAGRAGSVRWALHDDPVRFQPRRETLDDQLSSLLALWRGAACSESRGALPPLPDAASAVDSHSDVGPDVTELSEHRAELTISLQPASSSILAEIAESIGGVPRVLLRDTDIETGPGSILKPSSPEMPEPSVRPEKYQLFGEIGRGGMGAVLRGRDVDLGRELAVKVLLEAHKDKPELVKRFVEEAQIGGQLQHPGVVPVYEMGGFADRRPFFAMKLVKGRTLAELLSARWARVSRPRPEADRSRAPRSLRLASIPLHLRVGGADHGIRPCPRGDPPRPEAVQHHGRQLRRGASDGLGAGQGAAPRGSGGRRVEGNAGAVGPGERDPHGTIRIGRRCLDRG